VTPQALDPVVDKILTRLESRDVHDLKAKLRWELSSEVEEEEDANIKFGEIWYKEAEPVAKFLVVFEHKLVGDRRRPLDEKHLFDGRWYIKLEKQTKTVTRQEIRRADDPVDPYRIGEGPFPLPFGQKKADVLREFDVSRMPPAEGDPPATDHLRLVPREGTRTGERYRIVDLWIAREGACAGLPIKVRTAKRDGLSTITIAFEDVRLNTGFSDSVFKIETPLGYEEYVETLEPVPLPAGATSREPDK